MEEYPKICIIGGGFSGMCAGVQLQKQLGIHDYKIFEENSNFGGTWFANDYPGLCCDIPSHIYSFSFEPNPSWSTLYSTQEEILEYQLRVANKYELYKKASLNTRVESIEWIEDERKWHVKTFDKVGLLESDYYFDFIINCVGLLRAPKIPEEFSNFKGEKFHSGQWKNSVELKGKRVGVVGSGSSAVQIMPEILSKVGELHSFQRAPAWVGPKFNMGISPTLRKIFSSFPTIHKIFRLFIFLLLETLYTLFKSGSILNGLGKRLCLRQLEQQIPGDVGLRQSLTPNYPFACKRLVLASNYYPIFNQPNVFLYTEKITKIENKTITTADGKEQELDVLILCTGYRVQEFLDPLKVIGKKGLDVGHIWNSQGPSTYYGILSNLMPNIFFLDGPNTALGHNSFLFMIECQMEVCVKIIKECLKNGFKKILVKEYAEKGWMAENMQNLTKMTWSSACGNWYKNTDGQLTAVWAKNCISYKKETENINFKQFEFSY